MAELSDYQAVAPTITGLGVTKDQIETKLSSIPPTPEVEAEPAITKAQVIALFDDVFGESSLKRAFERHGGYGKLALKHGLKKHQVKKLISEMSAMLSIFSQPE